MAKKKKKCKGKCKVGNYYSQGNDVTEEDCEMMKWTLRKGGNVYRQSGTINPDPPPPK